MEYFKCSVIFFSSSTDSFFFKYFLVLWIQTHNYFQKNHTSLITGEPQYQLQKKKSKQVQDKQKF